MSSFEDEILSHIPSLKQEHAAVEAARLEQLSRQQTDAEAIVVERERLRGIGEQAARLLIDRDVEPLPAWRASIDNGPYIRGASAVSEKLRREFVMPDSVGEGWHIIDGKRHLYIQDGVDKKPFNIALMTNGELMQIDRTSHPITYAKGLINPRQLDVRRIRNILNDEGYKKSIAALIAGIGVYKMDFPGDPE